MSYVIVAPDAMTAAVTDLAAIGSALDAAHAAAVPALAVAPAAADEVSLGVAQLLTAHAQDYQAVAAAAAAFQGQFAQNLSSSAAAYASVEDVSAALLQGFKNGVRSFGTALESGIVYVDGAALRGVLALTPPDLYPAFLVFLLFSGLSVAVQIGIIENIIETISGQTALI